MALTQYSQKTYFIHRFILGISLCFFISCEKDTATSNAPSVKGNMRYAKGFDLLEKEGFTYLYLFRHYEKSVDTITYLLYERGKDTFPVGDFQAKIEVPVKKAISLSSPYSAMMERLDELKRIIAVSQADYVYSPELLKLVAQGAIQELGQDAQVDVEAALNLEPDVLMYSAFPGSQSRNIEQLSALGVPCLPFAEWQETTLLGRAEWIKVMGSLLGKKKMADRLFEEMQQEYERVKNKAKSVQHKPQILSSLPFKGIWSVPGGESYMAHVFEDAGADYFWKDQKQTASLPLSFEAVYPIGLKAEVWLSPGSVTTYKALEAQDERFADFLALKNRKVYHSYKRSNQKGGNDYWESGVIMPQVILKDMVKILHPDLLPGHEMVFFEELGE